MVADTSLADCSLSPNWHLERRKIVRLRTILRSRETRLALLLSNTGAGGRANRNRNSRSFDFGTGLASESAPSAQDDMGKKILSTTASLSTPRNTTAPKHSASFYLQSATCVLAGEFPLLAFFRIRSCSEIGTTHQIALSLSERTLRSYGSMVQVWSLGLRKN